MHNHVILHEKKSIRSSSLSKLEFIFKFLRQFGNFIDIFPSINRIGNTIGEIEFISGDSLILKIMIFNESHVFHFQVTNLKFEKSGNQFILEKIFRKIINFFSHLIEHLQHFIRIIIVINQQILIGIFFHFHIN